jgi:hypothetical protein
MAAQSTTEDRIHFWASDLGVERSPCNINMLTTAYALGSTEWHQVTCPSCRAFAPEPAMAATFQTVAVTTIVTLKVATDETITIGHRTTLTGGEIAERIRPTEADVKIRDGLVVEMEFTGNRVTGNGKPCRDIQSIHYDRTQLDRTDLPSIVWATVKMAVGVADR